MAFRISAAAAAIATQNLLYTTVERKGDITTARVVYIGDEPCGAAIRSVIEKGWKSGQLYSQCQRAEWTGLSTSQGSRYPYDGKPAATIVICQESYGIHSKSLERGKEFQAVRDCDVFVSGLVKCVRDAMSAQHDPAACVQDVNALVKPFIPAH